MKSESRRTGKRCYLGLDCSGPAPMKPPHSPRFRATLPSAILVAASLPLCAQSTVGKPATACTPAHQADSANVGQFLFQTFMRDDGACLRVLQSRKVVFRRTEDGGATFTLGQQADLAENIPAIRNGTDVTGRGHADMIVSFFTGGAHCCTQHLVFELEPAFHLLATLNDAHDDLAHFERIGSDPSYYYITADWTFAYWPSCFACSPSAEVILRFVDSPNGGGFHLAFDKMQTPAPSAAEWDRLLNAARKTVNKGSVTGIGTDVWRPVLNFLYTGHSDLAWKFLDELGPKAQQSRFPDLEDFCSLLKQSPYWPDLKPTLRDVPPACSKAERELSGDFDQPPHPGLAD